MVIVMAVDRSKTNGTTNRRRTWEEYVDSLDFDPASTEGYRQTRLAYGLGGMLRRLREALRSTQSQLAQVMGTSQPNVARLEGGAGLPALDTLMRYAEAVGGHLVVGVVKSEELHGSGGLAELVKSGQIVVEPPPPEHDVAGADSLSRFISRMVASPYLENPFHVRKAIDVHQSIDTICKQWAVSAAHPPTTLQQQSPLSSCVVVWDLVGEPTTNGRMTFRPIAPDRTEIAVDLDFDSPAGRTEQEAVGMVERQAEGDLARLKEFFESSV